MENLITEAPGKSGIYIIRCNKSKSVYVGSAKDLNQRCKEHNKRFRNKNHPNRHLQNIFNKFGQDSLSFNLLKYCEIDKLIQTEQYYIDNTKNLVNICKIAGSSLGVRRSKEQREFISQMHKGNKYWLGRKHTPETKAKMSQSKKGIVPSLESRLKMSKSQTGKKHSEETKTKMSKSRRRNLAERNRKIGDANIKHKVEQWDLEGNLLKIYNSVFDASRKMGYPRNSIYQAIEKNKHSRYKGHIWKKVKVKK